MKEQLREFRNKIFRRRLKNRDFTIIANNCIAFPDYILFLKNLKELVYAKFIQLPSVNGHPVGLLGG